MSETYMIARLNLKYGTVNEFNDIMTEFVPIFEEQGWKLHASYRSIIGSLTEVIDVWQVADANAVAEARAHASSHPDYARLAPRLFEIVESEVLSLVAKLPVSP